MDPSYKNTLCRLCLFKSERLIDIFGLNGVHGYIAAEVIEELLQCKVSRSDGFPQTICSPCLDKLAEFKMFKEQCKGNLAAFESGFDPDKFNFADGLLADSINFSPASLVKVEMMEDGEELEHHIALHGHYLDGCGQEADEKNHGKLYRRQEALAWGADMSAMAVGCQQQDIGTAGNLPAGLVTKGDDEKPFGCGICGKRFARSNKLVQHIRTHTGERPFVCEICGRAFNRKDKLSLHRKTHNSDKPYECRTCRKSFCRSDYLLAHRKAAHPDEELPHLPCAACGAAFANEKELAAHARTAHFSCADCDAAFGTEAELAAHAASANHSSGPQLDCVDCGKAFEDREKLRKHGKVHRRDASHACEWCGKVFYRMDKMLQHRRTHTKERPFRCDLCGKGFSRSDKMSEHRRIHDAAARGVKPHECPECGKRFSRGDYLTQHRKTHGDARRFKCGVCGKGFVSGRDLALHSGTHSTERPFPCADCGKAFKRKGALVSHRKGVHCGDAEQRQAAAAEVTSKMTQDILATYLQTPLA